MFLSLSVKTPHGVQQLLQSGSCLPNHLYSSDTNQTPFSLLLPEIRSSGSVFLPTPASHLLLPTPSRHLLPPTLARPLLLSPPATSLFLPTPARPSLFINPLASFSLSNTCAKCKITFRVASDLGKMYLLG